MASVQTNPVTLYIHPVSSNALRVQLYVREKGLSFEEKSVDLFAGENKKEEFLKINPRGQVPALKDGDVLVVESVAIIEYLEAVYKGKETLVPTSKHDLGLYFTRIAQFHQKLDPKLIFGAAVFQKKTKEELADKIQALMTEFAVWDANLKDHSYVAGSHFSNADIVIFPNVVLAILLGLKFDKLPHLGKWYHNLVDNRPVFKELVPKYLASWPNVPKILD